MSRRWTLGASLAGLVGAVAAGQSPAPPTPIPDKLPAAAREVPEAAMQRVYDAVKTPFKFGVVLRPREGESVDCPNVFRHDGRWYMLYVAIANEVGYETRLAASDDLLKWKPLGTVLPFRDAGWDRWQAAGSLALVDPTWGGSAALQPYDGRYWVSYFGGAKQGYERGRLEAGRFDTFAASYDLVHWTKWTGPDLVAPYLPWDKTYAHKPWLLEHDGVVYHFYCAVGTEGRVIGLATSRDLS